MKASCHRAVTGCAGIFLRAARLLCGSSSYRDLPVADYTQALVRVGVPELHAAALADSDLGIARGDLRVTSGDLARLIGTAGST